MTILYLDYETRSRCDLRSRGAYNYARDSSTQIICMAYAFDDEDVALWTPDQKFPKRVAQHFFDDGQIRAHNAGFDRLITEYVLCQDFLVPTPLLTQWYCTAAQARANCAPGSLEDVGRFASSSMRKDHRGNQLIRLLCIPRADGTFNTDPTLLAEMGNYALQDVRTMRSISQAMRQLSLDELMDYHVNERINDRGVLLDKPLAESAIRYASHELAEIENLVSEITQGEISSVRSPRMKEWVLARVGDDAKKLMENYKDGDKKYSIDKTVRANLLILAEENPEQIPPEVADVIQCADDLWASSVAKFNRLKDLADEEDHRVRGAFVFAGGSATGRASSYGAQVHNFTRKCAKDPDAVRQAMVRGHSIVPAFGRRVTDVLKGMLRPALIPASGRTLVVSDWSGIEARVNPWLSNCDAGIAKLSLFARGEDVYKVNAAATFHVGVADVNNEQRQIGKVQELACFTAETKVLTDNGVKDIVEVLLTDKLWDGTSWVNHQGLIPRGMREVINVCGVEVTPDHLIETRLTWTQAQKLALSRPLLTQALELGTGNLPYLDANELNKVLPGCGTPACNVIAKLNRTWSIYTTCLKAHLRVAMFAPRNQQGFGAKTISNTLTLAPMMHTAGVCLIDSPLANNDAITQKIKTTQTTVGGVSTCMNLGGLTKPHFYNMLYNLKGGINRIWNWIESTSIRDMSLTICALLLSEIIAITSGLCKKCKITFSSLKPVYDILNSGEKHRFTVVTNAGALLVHNCGFAGGIGAFAAMGRAYGILLPEPQAKRMVTAWRLANPWATPYWQDLEEAYTRAMRNPNHEFSAGRVTYMYDGQHLWYALPSGRVLCYPFAKLEADGVTYAKAAWKPAVDAKEWPRARLWKGLACENITQAVANDLLRYSLRQLDDVILHIHDEIVVETTQPEAMIKRMEEVMCTAPDWAKGIPLGVEIHAMQRYGK